VEVNLGGNSSRNNAGIDSDPYPSLAPVAKKWHRQTGPEFRFTIRIPDSVLRTGDEKSLGRFLEQLAPVEEKVLAVLLSVPSQMTLANGREWLDSVLASCTYHGYSATVQFANASWYQDLAYNILKKHGAAVVWSDSHPNTAITSDFLYLRLSGDNHGLWVEKLQEAGGDEEVKDVIIVLDSPAHANSFLKALGLPERTLHPHDTTSSLRQSSAAAAAASKTHSSDESRRRRWGSGRMIIMCVDLNAFYPSCEELRDPSLKGKAHAVIMTDQKAGEITKGVVSSCSYEARKFGVRSAMSLSRALSLCPHLILRPVDMPYYSKVSEQVMAVLEEYADVTIEQASIDEAFLDCTHMADAAADPEEFARKIKSAIRDRCGLLCSVGVAPTKSAAKIASDFRKPDGLTVVYPEDLQSFLDPLEVGRVSGIGNKTQGALKEMGIQTLGQLARADVQRLTARFGRRNGYWMWKVACGTDDEPVVPREDHVSLSSETTLDAFTRDRGVILQNLHGLVDGLYERAKRHGYLFRTVGVKLVRTDFTIETRESSYADLQDSREGIASPIEELLARFTISEDRPAIRKVGLRISHLVRKEKLLEKGQSAQKSMLDYYY
jgi:DNA polymerase IV (DinB-like DNA polymerase)